MRDKDAKLLKEIDTLFAKINDLGKSCKDVMDFETKFAASPLNKEYIDLFTKISQSSTYILKSNDAPVADEKTTGQEIKEEIEDEARYRMKEATLPARRLAREEAEKKLRSTPIIGDIMHVKQHIDLFGGIKRKRQAKEEQERLQKELEEQGK